MLGLLVAGCVFLALGLVAGRVLFGTWVQWMWAEFHGRDND